MPRPVFIHLLPALVAAEELRDQTVVVIDVLRATTTIGYALAAGAKQIIPCATVEQAHALRRELGPKTLLGGERRGVKIEGFDLGNSPGEYRADQVRGRNVVFTTTNGTQAMEHCRQAGRVLIGAFVNRAALAAALRDQPAVHLLCAGTAGGITREDTLLAGCLAAALCETDEVLGPRDAIAPAETELDPTNLGHGPFVLASDETRLAVDAWRVAQQDLAAGATLEQILAVSHGGRNTRRLGLTADLAPTADADSLDIVPELNLVMWSIR